MKKMDLFLTICISFISPISMIWLYLIWKRELAIAERRIQNDWQNVPGTYLDRFSLSDQHTLEFDISITQYVPTVSVAWV